MFDSRTIDYFDTLAKALLRCAVFGYLLLLLTIGVYILAGGELYRLNAGIVDLSKHEFDLIIYGCIVLIKLIVLLFFFIPWLAIRLVLRKLKA
jgi:hypothetical protein